jgi:hypothetical protein
LNCLAPADWDATTDVDVSQSVKCLPLSKSNEFGRPLAPVVVLSKLKGSGASITSLFNGSFSADVEIGNGRWSSPYWNMASTRMARRHRTRRSASALMRSPGDHQRRRGRDHYIVGKEITGLTLNGIRTSLTSEGMPGFDIYIHSAAGLAPVSGRSSQASGPVPPRAGQRDAGIYELEAADLAGAPAGAEKMKVMKCHPRHGRRCMDATVRRRRHSEGRREEAQQLRRSR